MYYHSEARPWDLKRLKITSTQLAPPVASYTGILPSPGFQYNRAGLREVDNSLMKRDNHPVSCTWNFFPNCNAFCHSDSDWKWRVYGAGLHVSSYYGKTLCHLKRSLTQSNTRRSININWKWSYSQRIRPTLKTNCKIFLLLLIKGFITLNPIFIGERVKLPP